MEKREDIRITKSKRDLRNALIELMKTTPFKKITVGDICSAAIINKMTFYKHYADKYELLNDVLLNIKQSIVDQVDTVMLKPPTADNITFLLLDTLINECLSFKHILLNSDDDIVLTMISTTIEKGINDLLSAIDQQIPFKYDLAALTAVATGATTFLIRYLLTHEQTINKQEFLESAKQFLYDLFESKILYKS